MHDEEGGTSTLAMLTEGNANALSAAALEQLELEMAEGEKAAAAWATPVTRLVAPGPFCPASTTPARPEARA